MTSLLLAAILVCAVTHAGAADEKDDMAFPTTMFVIEGPPGTSARGRVADNRITIGGASGIRYQGALARADAAKSLGAISWRHISKTEAGDIYLVVFTRPDGEREATAILFNGHSDVSSRRGNWRITFTNEKGA